MRAISRKQIIGSRITAVFERDEISADGLDCAYVYFETDGGVTFSIPSPGKEWFEVSVPLEAKQLTHDVVKWICRQTIREVLFEAPDLDGFIDPQSAELLLSDGSRVSVTMVAPHGTGAAGLYCLMPSDVTSKASIDYWSIPIEVREKE